jgi:hypothetical protein
MQAVGLGRWVRIVLVAALVFLGIGLLSTSASAAPVVPVPAGGVVAAQTGMRSSLVYTNVTVAGAQANGILIVYTCGSPRPSVSSMTYAAMRNTSVSVAVRSDADGFVCFYSSAATHVVVDFVGRDPANPAPSSARLLDTRLSTAPTRGQVFGNGQVVVINTGIPNATVFGTLTTVSSQTTGYLVLYTCGTARPAISTTLFAPAETRATLAVGRTDSRGQLCLYSTGPTHAVYDRITASGSSVAQTPVRRMDTRPFGSPTAGAVVRIPTGAPQGWTVWGSLTTTGAEASGFTTAFTCTDPVPNTSAVQAIPGVTVSQLVGVRADARGDICVRVSSPAHVVFDQAAVGITTGTINVRVLDTRTLAVPRHPGTGKEFYSSVRRWADNAAAALTYQGLSVNYLPGVLAQVQQESSGIPNAVNNWDSNWQRGIASFGLLQTIYPTFNFYAPPECKGPNVGTVVRDRRQQYHPNMVNPDCNLRSALNYVKNRYGTARLDLWNQGINRAY